MLNCEHSPTIITGSRGSNGSSRVTVCRKCGEFKITGDKDGVHFSKSFSLYGSYELLAASQAHRLMSIPDAEVPSGKRIWKPLDLAQQRLYHVVRAWDVKEGDKQTNYKDNHIVAADSPSHAAALVEATYQQYYEENAERIPLHYSEGFPLNVLQPLEWTLNGIPLLNLEFDEGNFVPGEFRCTTCQFRLHKRLISRDMGTVGVDSDAQPEPCPNDSTMMVRVTWREAAEDAGHIAGSWMKRAKALEDAWPSDTAMPADEDLVESAEGAVM